MKIIFFLFFLYTTSLLRHELFAQNFEADGKIEVKLDRPFTESFRVKNYTVTSGNLEVDKGLSENHNAETGGTKIGFGINNKFSNFGGSGLFTIYQSSPFKGMEGWFVFEENINGEWKDAASLHVNFPIVGSNEITLNYFDGFGYSYMNFDNPNTYISYKTSKELAVGNGYKLIDRMYKGNDIEPGTNYQLKVSIKTREWLKSTVNLPVIGNTTAYGMIKIDAASLKPAVGVSLIKAVQNTFILNANSYSRAQWLKLDNNNSNIQLQFSKVVGTVVFYDADDKNYTVKYKIINLPDILLGLKYFNNQLELKTALKCCGFQSELVGNYLYTDIAQKANGIQNIYEWLSFKFVQDNVNTFWQAADQNNFATVDKKIFDKNNITNEQPQFLLNALNTDGLVLLSNINNTHAGRDSNMIITNGPSFTLQGLWTIANAKNGFVFDPFTSGIKKIFAPVINPAELNLKVAANISQMQLHLNADKISVIQRRVEGKIINAKQVVDKNKIFNK